MHTFGFDPQSATLVSVMSGTFREEDFDDFVRASLMLDAEGAKRKLRTAHIFFVEEGYPRPNANARRKIADSLLQFKAEKPLFALITASSVIRGLVTVVSWVSPKQVHEIESFGTFEEGVLWLEKHRGERLPSLPALLREAQSKKNML
jgi:hypothetical protein